MVSINYATREVTCKIVYYGPGLSGKTTNLQYIHDKIPGDTRGKMISLATEADRTLYFDFLPINIGKISGLSAKFQLYTVPGQVYYNATRKLVLRGADGLVFVADSQADKMDENIESINNMKENLAEYGYDINEMPIVIQYNKRDLPNVLPVEELEAKLNPYGWKYFEGEAVNGRGVFDTLKMSIKLVLDKARHGKTDRGAKKEADADSKREEVHAAAKGQATPAANAASVKTTSAVTPADGRVSEPVRKSAYQAVSDGSKGRSRILLRSKMPHLLSKSRLSGPVRVDIWRPPSRKRRLKKKIRTGDRIVLSPDRHRVLAAEGEGLLYPIFSRRQNPKPETPEAMRVVHRRKMNPVHIRNGIRQQWRRQRASKRKNVVSSSACLE